LRKASFLRDQSRVFFCAVFTLPGRSASSSEGKGVHSDAIHRVIESLWSEKGQLTELAAAALVGLSVERFRRVFRNIIGVNFRVFRLRIKLEYGRYLLKDTALSVADVAASWVMRREANLKSHSNARFA
jgi:transcriptional regulator GlxA family with amidase domain